MATESHAQSPTLVPAPPPARAPEVAADRLPTAPPDSSTRLPVQQELTAALHLYQTDHQKLPADFSVLVREKYLKALPQPPAGKRFAVDRNRVQVVILD